jgi:acyl carrier protein phosphodiesterase
MNYLAHIYLSGSNKLVMIGNFIGDAVKGRAYENLHPMIQKGILLHRTIDDYTDRYPLNAEIRKLLHPVCGKYAGVYLDMFYDHFLAAGWDDFSPQVSLHSFCIRFYFDALLKYKHLPPKIRAFLPSLIMKNRLQSYREINKLREALEIMTTYTSLPRTTSQAITCLIDNYDTMKAAFYDFFPNIIDHTSEWRREND